jgi:hypothetical protein
MLIDFCPGRLACVEAIDAIDGANDIAVDASIALRRNSLRDFR